MNTYSGVIAIGFHEFWAEVDYISIPFSKGAREAYGMQIEPDEPAHIEIEAVRVCYDPDNQSGKYYPIDLPSVVLEDIMQEIEEA